MLIVLLGPSGVGKSSIEKELGLPLIVSTTVRPPRPGEVDDVDYHFVTKEEFETLDLVERVVYNNTDYGYQRKDVEDALASDKDHLMLMEAAGVRIFNVMYPGEVFVFYLTATLETLISRMRKRGDSEENIKDRVTNMHAQGELTNHDLANMEIESIDVPTSVSRIKEVLASWRDPINAS